MQKKLGSPSLISSGCCVNSLNLKASVQVYEAVFVCVYAKPESTQHKGLFSEVENAIQLCLCSPAATAASSEEKHGTETLCQRRLTRLSIMTFWMIVTFGLLRSYQQHSGADIYLLLLLSGCLQTV